MTDTPAADGAVAPRVQGLKERLVRAVVAPVRAFRREYLPVLAIYFSYGALGMMAVAQDFWERRGLTLTPADLAALLVWTTLPWAVKMVFGELVDSVAFLGSRRRSYICLGAALVATSLVLLAGSAGGWITFASRDAIYIGASILLAIGVVMQDVVADAMSTEVVSRVDATGAPRPTADVNYDLGMLQALGRLALFAGILSTARLGGWLASVLSYDKVFLAALAVPLISVAAAILVRHEPTEQRPTDWRLLGGGIAFGLAVVTLGLLQVPFGQEIIFVISLTVIVTMLRRVTSELAPVERQRIGTVAATVFCFRAGPLIGAAMVWYGIDRLGFDEVFKGRIEELKGLLGLLTAWLLADAINRQPIRRILLWLTFAGLIFAGPNLLLVLGAHQWTEAALGVGARGIALVDAGAQTVLLQISMIPLLTLMAIYAPPKHRATWFALMASLLNLALVAGQLIAKYLNMVYKVERGAFDNLTALYIATAALAFLIPLIALLTVGRRLK